MDLPTARSRDISFPAFVRDLETVVESIHVERAAFLGISQGAAVAIAYAVRHPERVSKLILYGGYAQGRNKRGSAADAEVARAFAHHHAARMGRRALGLHESIQLGVLPERLHRSRSNGWSTCSGSRRHRRTRLVFGMFAMISTS